ncbi:zf-TFIIB domain-containing protein [Kribbella sp. NBC_01245]|uniref:TFIIB-type zinc ribbon-containing protein n=1 Tax=Kribbella sp. NBC_01245 TaxID=2903578 RepID=UPI002E2DC4ED|nr:zf-TFIIB domain-containing protein [Kribbella sp. NBC_01245]
MEPLICPKCQGSMRVYERSGVTVDQCTECRGIFLDRGELEKLVDAEESYNAPPAAAPLPPQPAPQQPKYDDRRYEDKRRYEDDRYRQQQPYRGKKKKSFFEELFD